MDDGTRHADGTMEAEAAFDLNTAIREWREDLASRPGFRAEDLEELETHLREGVQDLQQRGLSVAEAFLIASRRLGTPSNLQNAFSRLNRHAVWLERLVWMLFGYACVAGMLSLQRLLAFVLSPIGPQSGLQPILVIMWGIPVLLAFWTVQSIVREGRPPRFMSSPLEHPWGLALLGFALCSVPQLMVSGTLNSIGAGSYSVGTAMFRQWILTGTMSVVWAGFVALMILVAARSRLRLIRE